ncbi:hypothetical protein KP509_22G000700 [Ceratopteris richardii]|nr:hypothetical protein KP509_22G000700 [Ceratopteris richardii]
MDPLQIGELDNLIKEVMKSISDLNDLIDTAIEKDRRMIKDGYAARGTAEWPMSQDCKTSNESKARFGFSSFISNLPTLFEQVKHLNKPLKPVSREEHCPESIDDGRITDTGLYLTEATPATLNKLVNTVRNRVSACATKLLEVAESRETFIQFLIGEIEALPQRLEIRADEKYPLIKNSLTEAVICKYMFLNFECAHFSSNPQQVFEKPDELKRKRIVTYKQNKEEEPGIMRTTLPEFEKFVSRKVSHFKDRLGKFFKENTVRNDIIQRFEDFNSDHGRAFLRLCKEVWLLHVLAIACEPASAEIFRVPAGSQFMADYMHESEDICPQRVNRRDGSAEDGRIVACMTVPGFKLRHDIIKAYVCCVDSLNT